jgi:hypothetical protein
MKKVLSTIVAAIVALSFSAVVFAADAPVPAATSVPAAVEKKDVTPTKECGKKCKKAKECKKRKKCHCKPECAKNNEKKEETPVAPAAK